ncbi:MAG: hypothetical protein ACK5QW_06065 [Cyanobacteriota bacterium]
MLLSVVLDRLVTAGLTLLPLPLPRATIDGSITARSIGPSRAASDILAP